MDGGGCITGRVGRGGGGVFAGICGGGRCVFAVITHNGRGRGKGVDYLFVESMLANFLCVYYRRSARSML